MTNLESYKQKLLELKELRAKATQGTWVKSRGASSMGCHVEVNQETIAIACEKDKCDVHERFDSAFIATAANTYDQLLFDLLSCVEALEHCQIFDTSGTMGEYEYGQIVNRRSPDMGGSCGAWEAKKYLNELGEIK